MKNLLVLNVFMFCCSLPMFASSCSAGVFSSSISSYFCFYCSSSFSQPLVPLSRFHFCFYVCHCYIVKMSFSPSCSSFGTKCFLTCFWIICFFHYCTIIFYYHVSSIFLLLLVFIFFVVPVSIVVIAILLLVLLLLMFLCLLLGLL